jgi:hypothetical protein
LSPGVTAEEGSTTKSSFFLEVKRDIKLFALENSGTLVIPTVGGVEEGGVVEDRELEFGFGFEFEFEFMAGIEDTEEGREEIEMDCLSAGEGGGVVESLLRRFEREEVVRVKEEESEVPGEGVVESDVLRVFVLSPSFSAPSISSSSPSDC